MLSDRLVVPVQPLRLAQPATKKHRAICDESQIGDSGDQLLCMNWGDPALNSKG